MVSQLKNQLQLNNPLNVVYNGNFKWDAAPKQRDEASASTYYRIEEGYRGYDTGSDHRPNGGSWTSALCPRNIKLEACRECLNNTIPYLNKSCPKQREGVAWTALPKVTYIVRYSDSSFRGRFDAWAWTTFSSPLNQTPASAIDLEKGLNTLADKLKRPAAGGGMLQMFASGAIAYGPGPRGSWPLYGYMQCTPDIRKEDCMKCLTDATNAIHNCCSKGRKLAAIV
ncbi:hypothetical protein SSX86_008761 [Deinandra increscens subsp. villosa]|uniref:Gnk2-homologous domain-containing protein n=1 Tax=Deinandra increscens subsp. villosa TaxID=3103831 RepID=A0AAP0H2B9_9ASTR